MSHLAIIKERNYWENSFEKRGEAFLNSLPPPHQCVFEEDIVNSSPMQTLSRCRACFEDPRPFRRTPGSLLTIGVLRSQTVSRDEFNSLYPGSPFVNPPQQTGGHHQGPQFTHADENPFHSAQAPATEESHYDRDDIYASSNVDVESQVRVQPRPPIIPTLSVPALASHIVGVLSSLLHGLL
ncbi:hypothetical protein NMY22_g13630 [Coprinellus aureogranulatus]|nr:hypothetical protein NMY22_g13630 [Coprinellus aureogranulatus]